jgi:hypothetical protein
MRGLTKDALVHMELSSQSWEYASEMVLKSVHMRMRTTEVPVRFLKDREGRLSHHKRSGWFSPFSAAWINLRAMFVYGVDFFVFRPGVVLSVIGIALVLLPTFGAITLGNVTLSVNFQLFGLVIAMVGVESFAFGCIARVLFDYVGTARRRWLHVFRYTRTVAIAGILVVAGVLLALPLLRRYLSEGLQLSGDVLAQQHLAVTGALFVLVGFTLFVFTLLLHATALLTHAGRGPAGGS